MPERFNTWHDGERAVQERVGSAERLERRAFPHFLPADHRWFLAQLPMLVVGSVDAEGRPWASVLSGPPGFAASPNPETLRVSAAAPAGDPLHETIVPGAPVGMLGIDFALGARIRINGRVAAADPSGFTVRVDQSFGNCPKYIHARDYTELPLAPLPATAFELFAGIDAEARDLVARADTFFVASRARPGGDPALHGVDVSHRGGPAGFVRVDASGTLHVPDYRGNQYFNTLGNLLVNPRAGLLFADFVNGDLLLLTGSTEIEFDGAALRELRGAERVWRLRPERGRRLRGALGLRFATLD